MFQKVYSYIKPIIIRQLNMPSKIMSTGKMNVLDFMGCQENLTLWEILHKDIEIILLPADN